MTLLKGTTVLDFSRVLAGPLATQIMAELGADVIKIEQPGTGDESRQFEPRLPHGESAYFFAFNRGKRSVTLDLKHPRGQSIAHALAGSADVLVENFPPGTMGRMGLAYDDLATANPRLVYVSSTAFGQTGPYRDRKGYDTIFQAMSGIMSLTGERDGPPAKSGVPVSDMTSAFWIVIAALGGLLGREASGGGGHFDLAMMDVQVSLLALAAARVFAGHDAPVRQGSEHPGRVPSAAFRCADGRWLQISASDRHWPPLCEVLDLHALGGDPSLRENAGRVAARDRVMDGLRVAILARDSRSLAVALREAGVPVGEVKTVPEALDDAHTRARGMVRSFAHPTEGAFPALATPLRLDSEPGADLTPPPLIGADTHQVLRDVLGLDGAELRALRAEGVI